MGIIKTHFGQPSYTLSGSHVKTFITVQGGHLTARFKTGNREINPFFIAPWWDEAPVKDEDEIIRVLRGDFFCFPFGGNEEPYEGIKYPVHGQTANANWDFVSFSKEDNAREISLKMDLDNNRGTVEKYIRVDDGSPVIYSRHIVKNYSGKMPIGHHPTLKLPDRTGCGIVDISEPVDGFTTPVAAENPENGGYSRIKPGARITDRSRVPCIDGSVVDITHYPTPSGFEDIVIFISDQKREFVYTAVSVPSEGYLYFQLKNPRVLAHTLFWMSNGGRHYPPWNGRVRSVIGVEEITAFFHYGIKAGVENNPFQDKGYKSFVEIKKESPLDVRLIMGLVPISEDFTGVKDIVKKNETTITIIGRGGEKIDIPCRLDFLR